MPEQNTEPKERTTMWKKQALSQRIQQARFRSRVWRRPLVWWRQRGIHPNDVFIVSYPRSGTTWLRFVLFEALTGDPAEFETVNRGIPYVGRQATAPRLLPDGGRLIQSHESYTRDVHRLIYIVRDPRAVLLSEYQWQLRTGFVKSGFDDFLDDFLKGRVNPFARWDDHARIWLNHRMQDPNVHLVKFESLHSDTAETVGRLTDWLGLSLPRDRIEAAVINNSVARMRQKEDRAPTEVLGRPQQVNNRFINTGSLEGWRARLSSEQARRTEECFAKELELLGYERST
ncbi:MAG: sulfotransferase domain-containing protein [Actinomycetota bacterium]